MFLMSKVTVTIQQALCAVIGQVWRSEKSKARFDLLTQSVFLSHFFHIFFCHFQYVQMSAEHFHYSVSNSIGLDIKTMKCKWFS